MLRMSAQEYRQLVGGETNLQRPRPKQGKRNEPSYLEALFLQQINALRIARPHAEYRFHPKRKWRFDFAWPERRLAVEIEGGVMSKGRHVRPQGFTNDCEKYNQATQLAWQVLRFTGQDVKSGKAIAMVESLFEDCAGKSLGIKPALNEN